ncbi:MAG: hypothetical protein ACYDEE_00220 [Ignavibacteriaceae bacterium]
MSDVNEEFSRLFLEQCGFLVRTNIKYYVAEEGNVGGDSDIDLVAFNLEPDRRNPPNDFILTVATLKGIEYASIETKGWHQSHLVPSIIRSTPRIFNFVRPEAKSKATEVLNTAHFKSILIVSSLPTTDNTKIESIRLLRDGGIDHVIEFKTILEKLWEDIEINKNYQSHILQTMRLIKKYITI